MKNWFLVYTILLFSLSESIISQTITNPNYSLKSHETLEITKIETVAGSTVFYMSITNLIEGGSFCADKKIYIVYPDGKQSKMTASFGIPNCPDTHKFKSIGEKLEFSLTFQAMKQGTVWIDLIEDCADNCFFFFGVILDNELNRKINEGFAKADNSDPASAITGFIDILEETDSKNLGSEGLLYINIINLLVRTGDNIKAAEWYNRFKLSGVPRLSQYIKFLNDQGIKY